tara:strand:- start:48 stop:239 length:192 start_codon:yes stop_codon:yes gene_type:complete
MRFAGSEIGYDLDKDLDNNLRDLIRKPRSSYPFESDFYEMAPEDSEPEYSMSGRYQPEVAYGR